MKRTERVFFAIMKFFIIIIGLGFFMEMAIAEKYEMVDTIADTAKMRDTHIYGLAGMSNFNFGALDKFTVGRKAGAGQRIYRGLLWFDSNNWPDSSRLDSAFIELSIGGSGGADSIWLTMREVLVNWGEGHDGGSIPDSCDSAATWSYRYYDSSQLYCPADTIRWTLAGCASDGFDRSVAIFDSTKAGGPQSHCRFDISTLAKKWAVQPSLNFGVLVAGPEADSSYRELCSKNAGNPSERPRCILYYHYHARIAYVVADTTSLGADTSFTKRLFNQLGYKVKLIDDDQVNGYPSWSEDVDGIVISDLALASKVASLKDTAVGILTMDRYTETEFGFGATNYRPSGHGRRLMNRHDCDFLCAPFQDTIYPYQYDNQYFYFYGDLASGARVPFNTPDWSGHDTACVILLEQGDSLSGGGTAVERRAFGGIFRTPDAMDYCLSWEVFDRLAAWICKDTSNEWLSSYRCWGGPLEIDACWCEMVAGDNDSATYNSEFRFGFDYDDIIGFWRLREPEKKRSAGYYCDSLVLSFPIFNLGFNGTPSDSIMDIRIGVFRIINEHKWHGPPPNSGGDPYKLDSTWVTRWDVISGGAAVPWDTLDLRIGVDYDSTILDTFHLYYPHDSLGDTVRFVIPGSVFETWIADTANNNGLVFKVTAVYDSSSNIEYGARPPIENALSGHLTVQAWFKKLSESSDPVGNLIGTGLIDNLRRKLIH